MMLKPYCQSVLQIPVPLVVVLARQSMRIDQITKLAPGVLIHFDMPYETPLHVEVGEQSIANGNIVKTGDRLGIRIGSILKPAERFQKITDQPSTSACYLPTPPVSVP